MEPKQRFKAVREHYNLSMGAFGEKIGLSTSGVSAIEYGTRVLGEKHVKLICAAFPEISEHWLRTGEGEMFLPKPESSLPAEITNDPLIRAILEAYIDLDPQARRVFRDYFASVLARYKGESLSDTHNDTLAAARSGKRIPLIQGADESEIQIAYHAKLEQCEVDQIDPDQPFTTSDGTTIKIQTLN